MRVPIALRSNERTQLDEFIPRVVERLEDLELADEAEEIDNVSIIDNEDGTYSAEATEWAAIIGGLRVLRDDEGLRSWWLRKKLAQRLSRMVENLGETEEGRAEGGSSDSNPTPHVEETGSQPAAA